MPNRVLSHSVGHWLELIQSLPLALSLGLQEMATLDALSFAANFGDALPYPYEMVTRLNLPRKRPLGK